MREPGPWERAWLANQIQGFRIQDRGEAGEKKVKFHNLFVADPCETQGCRAPYNVGCRVVGNKAQCICPTCPNITRPVCGSDDVQDLSECHLRRQACQGDMIVFTTKRSPCGRSMPFCEFKSSKIPWGICIFWLLVVLSPCLFASFLFRWRNDLSNCKNRNPDVDLKFLFCQLATADGWKNANTSHRNVTRLNKKESLNLQVFFKLIARKIEILGFTQEDLFLTSKKMRRKNRNYLLTGQLTVGTLLVTPIIF